MAVKKTVVDVSEVKFSRDAQETLLAPSLGSCIAVSAYDQSRHAGGVVIFMLPNAQELAFSAGDAHPYMFADTAIPNFVRAAERFGLDKAAMTFGVVGGGQMMGQAGRSDVGGRNSDMAHRLLSALGIRPGLVDVGGRRNRTLTLRIADGEIEVDVAGQSLER